MAQRAVETVQVVMDDIIQKSIEQFIHMLRDCDIDQVIHIESQVENDGFRKEMEKLEESYYNDISDIKMYVDIDNHSLVFNYNVAHVIYVYTLYSVGNSKKIGKFSVTNCTITITTIIISDQDTKCLESVVDGHDIESFAFENDEHVSFNGFLAHYVYIMRYIYKYYPFLFGDDFDEKLRRHFGCGWKLIDGFEAHKVHLL